MAQQGEGLVFQRTVVVGPGGGYAVQFVVRVHIAVDEQQQRVAMGDERRAVDEVAQALPVLGFAGGVEQLRCHIGMFDDVARQATRTLAGQPVVQLVRAVRRGVTFDLYAQYLDGRVVADAVDGVPQPLQLVAVVQVVGLHLRHPDGIRQVGTSAQLLYVVDLHHLVGIAVGDDGRRHAQHALFVVQLGATAVGAHHKQAQQGDTHPLLASHRLLVDLVVLCLAVAILQGVGHVQRVLRGAYVVIVGPRAHNLDSGEVGHLVVEHQLRNDEDALLAGQRATQQGKAHGEAELVGATLSQQHIVDAHHQRSVLVFLLVFVIIKRNDKLLGQRLTGRAKQQDQQHQKASDTAKAVPENGAICCCQMLHS